MRFCALFTVLLPYNLMDLLHEGDVHLVVCADWVSQNSEKLDAFDMSGIKISKQKRGFRDNLAVNV